MKTPREAVHAALAALQPADWAMRVCSPGTVHTEVCDAMVAAIEARDREHAAALAQARADALGEAAALVREQAKHAPGWGYDEHLGAVLNALDGAAQVIAREALQSTPPASAPPACDGSCDGSGWLPPDVAHVYAGRLRCHGCPNCKSKERDADALPTR